MRLTAAEYERVRLQEFEGIGDRRGGSDIGDRVRGGDEADHQAPSFRYVLTAGLMKSYLWTY